MRFFTMLFVVMATASSVFSEGEITAKFKKNNEILDVTLDSSVSKVGKQKFNFMKTLLSSYGWKETRSNDLGGNHISIKDAKKFWTAQDVPAALMIGWGIGQSAGVACDNQSVPHGYTVAEGITQIIRALEERH